MSKFELLKRAFAEYQTALDSWQYNVEYGNDVEISINQQDLDFWKAIIDMILEK